MMNRIVDNIHHSPYRAVLSISGGGTDAISRLLKHGNGSATLIDAIVPYSLEAMDNWIGSKPDKYCSAATARAMAMRAYQHAVHLTDGQQVIGIGATSKLSKVTPERKDRIHEIHVSSQTDKKTLLASLELKYPRRRENQEVIAADLILNILARSCGIPENVLPIYPDFKEELSIRESRRTPEIEEVVCGRSKIAKISFCNDQVSPKIIFPGSFNPLHKNHIAMAKYAAKKLGYRVSFEISVENPDKPTLDYLTIEDRLSQFEQFANNDWIGDIYLTNAPLFAQKADLFPGAIFLVGYDTFVRIANSKYYLPHEFEATIESFKTKNIRFIAFHRVNTEIVVTQTLFELATMVSPNDYVDDGTSSTKIRNE